MIKGFDDYPFVNEPYNKSYYPDLFEDSGFVMFKKWYSGVYSEEGFNNYQKRMEIICRRVSSKGYKFRTFDRKRFDDDFFLVYRLIMDSFSGFYRIDFKAFRELYFDFYKTFISQDFVHFAINPAGGDIGFIVMMPDLNSICRAWAISNRSNPLLGKLKFLFADKGNFQCNALFLGLSEDERKKYSGAGMGLTYLGFKSARESGIKKIGMVLIAEDSYNSRFLDYAPLNPHQYGLYKRDLF